MIYTCFYTLWYKNDWITWLWDLINSVQNEPKRKNYLTALLKSEP